MYFERKKKDAYLSQTKHTVNPVGRDFAHCVLVALFFLIDQYFVKGGLVKGILFSTVGKCQHSPS